MTRNMTRLSIVAIGAIAALGLAVLSAADNTQTAYADKSAASEHASEKVTQHAFQQACETEKNPNCVIPEPDDDDDDDGDVGTDAGSSPIFSSGHPLWGVNA
jgi:hypothetical protein